MVAAAFVKVLQRLREWQGQRKEEEEPALIEISRGAAALLAAARVGEEFGEQGTLAIEAVEEPSSIAGNEVTELSYVGVEPWIVLLRNDERRTRYIVVVMPDGRLTGTLRVPFVAFEELFLRPPEFG